MFGKKWIAGALLALLFLASCGSTKNNRFGNRVQKTGKQARVQKKASPKLAVQKNEQNCKA